MGQSMDPTKEDDLADFNLADDGFRTVNDEGPLVADLDAKPDSAIDSKGVTLDKVDVLLAQSGTKIDADLGLSVVTVDNLADVGFSIKSVDAPFVMQFTDVRVLREFIRRHGMFGVSIACLRNIPDVVKDRLYEQSVWDLNSIDYPVLLDRVQAVADSLAAKRRKDEVQKRMRRRETQRVTEERKGPGDETGFLKQGSSAEDEDEAQFDGDNNG